MPGTWDNLDYTLGTWNNITYATDTVTPTDWMTYATTAMPSAQDACLDFLSTKEIDTLVRKIYRIFSEHLSIDISEDEFITLLKEEDT